MWHFTPHFNFQTPDKIWQTDNKQNLATSLALTMLLTETKNEDTGGFWGNANIGSGLAHYLKNRNRANQVALNNTTEIDIIRQEINTKLQFLIREKLANIITVEIEAREKSYVIFIRIDDVLVQI